MAIPNTAGTVYSQSYPLTIFCDFDGTITTGDVTDSLLERYALPQWLDFEEEWGKGRIGSLECMQQQVGLLRCSREEMNAHLRQVRIDPTFPDFVKFCGSLGVEVVVVSDGIDYVIRSILRRHGLSHLPVFANHLEFTVDGRYSLSFPNANPGCLRQSGTCKCEILRRSCSNSILVGDGRSDHCAAASAALVFAKDSLLDHCRATGVAHLPYERFSDISVFLYPQIDFSYKGAFLVSQLRSLEVNFHAR